MKLKHTLAIDLGTETSRLFNKEDGLLVEEKTVCLCKKDDIYYKIIAIGNEAIKKYNQNKRKYQLIKLIKNGCINHYILEDYIKILIKKNLEFALLKPIIICSVPYNLQYTCRHLINRAIQKAGANRIFLIETPMVSAVGLDLESTKSDKANLIIDLGAGTTDIAIVSNGGIVYGKSIKVAGDEIDKAIISYIKNRYQILINKDLAQKIKHQIATAPNYKEEIVMTIEYYDKDYSNNRTLQLSSKELEATIQNQLDKIIEAISEVIYDFPSSDSNSYNALKIEETNYYTTYNLDKESIMLTGGTSILKGLKEYMQDKLEMDTKVSSNPFHDNINGVSKALEKLEVIMKKFQ